MFTLSAFRFFLFFLISAHLSNAQYVPPEALVEPLTPVGLRISIPDEPGITLVAFHVKFNQEFNGLEAGTIARDIMKPKNGRWTYEDKSTRLNENDVIYYWVHVVYNRLGYNLLEQEHTVTDFYEYQDSKPTTNAHFVVPEALVQPLTPVGIRISIPDEPGITLVAFHVKFNEAFNGLEAGTIARDIMKPNNGRWTYEDRSTKLKSNDIVYYWIHVVYNRLGYNLLDQEHRVTDFFNYKGKIQPQMDNKGGDFKPRPCVYSTTKLFDKAGFSKNPCAGQLLFKEDFRDLAQLRRSQWTIVEQYPGSPDYEFVVYRNSPENIKVENGLMITPKLLRNEFGANFVREGSLSLINCTGRFLTAECYSKARGWNILPPVTSGRVNTKNSINFEYGRVEIRAKLPRGEWIYPLLLLEPARNMPGSPLEAVQIRIASSAGNTELRLRDGSDIGGHLLWGDITGLNPQKSENHNQNRPIIYNQELWSDNFHVYELIWSPGRIVLKVDGQVYGDKSVNLPSDTPFYLTLGVAAGGRSEFPDNSVSRGFAKTWRNVEAKAMYHFYKATDIWYGTWQNGATSLSVDYVKIWAL
ncbi:hypothetical protein TSAR_005182 [Trichomalopsis sarcophagae]|uniref:Uncharacterized protein n=1 Tax=Trichomalopsis sarcophagae TaxID=543379 RepID=A0A232ES71_9HYME|nr:hypothetical protein TSAR_005182 [Trichomalopsis sarcophagae]